MGWVDHDLEILEEMRGWEWEEYEERLGEVYPHFFKKEKEGRKDVDT